MSNDKFALSIGSLNISIANISSGEILSEKNVIAIRDKSSVAAYLNDAYDAYERAPENVDVIFPMKEGVISNIEMMQLILEHIYKKLCHGRLYKGAEFLIAVPSDTTEVEKRAFFELVADSKIKPGEIYLTEKSIADAVFCGFDLKSPQGNLIADIGAATTDISVISLGGIVNTTTLKTGGIKLSEQLVQSVRRGKGRLLGLKGAEKLLLNMADLTDGAENISQSVFCRDIAKGLPVRTLISRNDILPVIKQELSQIIAEIRHTLEFTPPELAADIMDNGIYLAGGVAGMPGIASFFEAGLGLKVHVPKDPEYCTIKGLLEIFSNKRNFKLMYIPMEKEYN